MHWKEGKIFSIRLRDGSFALLQMLARKGQVAVFNQFQSEDRWDNFQPKPEHVLFVCWILRSVWQRSVVAKHDRVSPLAGIVSPDTVLHAGSGFRQVTLWPRTENERTLLIGGTGQNSLWHRVMEGDVMREELKPISNADYEQWKQVELSNLRDYPEFNERLLLCAKRKTNFDPLRELAFDRPLDLDCRVYADILSGKAKISDFGY